MRSGVRVTGVSEDVGLQGAISRDASTDDRLSTENTDVSSSLSTDIPLTRDVTPLADGGVTPRDEDAAGPFDAGSGDGGLAIDGGARDVAVLPQSPGASCQAGLQCGLPTARGSCCETLAVPEGAVLMGRSVDGIDQFPVTNPEELPEHRLVVPAFSLDRYEVTVGRFRAFLEAWNGAPLPEGAGANASVPASGWQPAWNEHLAQTRVEAVSRLHCAGGAESWTDAPGPNEERPMGCLNWYEAFAFCIWDGGRLATEAEWERAAAGGEENRVYPWGNAEPDCARVAPWHDCTTMNDAFAPVGSHPTGRGLWGHDDFAGGAEEWTLDCWGYYRAPYPLANLTPEFPADTPRTLRGLSFYGGMGDMRAADRGTAPPDNRYVRFGVRCAHDLPR